MQIASKDNISNELPYDRVLKCITGNGSQWISTGLQSDIDFVFDLRFSIPVQNGSLVFGQRNVDDYRDQRVFFTNGKLYWDYYGSMRIEGFSHLKLGETWDLTLKKGLVVDNSTGMTMTGQTVSGNYEQEYDLDLRWFWRSDSSIASGSIYGYRIAKGEAVVQDAIPVLAGGEACLYDKVTKTLLKNRGSGAFGYETRSGEVVRPVA